MSTLTKVFVVLLVVFSITFSAMTISVVARMTNWRDLASTYQEHAKVADANMRQLIASNAAELASAMDWVESEAALRAEAQAESEKLRGEVATLKAQLAQAEAEKSNAEASARALLAQLQSSEAERAEYRSQRDELEQQNVDLSRRNMDLGDRVNEQTAQIAVMLAEKRELEQQINVLRQESDRLAQQTGQPSAAGAFEDASAAGMTGVSPVTPISATPIRGKVMSISEDIVTITVGAADGVKEGMIFVIHRNGNYIGDVKVTVVDPNRAAGRLTQKGAEPMVGDLVTDAAALSSAGSKAAG